MQSKDSTTLIHRRTALKAILASATAPAFVPARLFGENAPSKRITLGCVGMGGQGVHANLNSFLNQEDAQVLAVCDVFKSKSEAAQQRVNNRYKNTDCDQYVFKGVTVKSEQGENRSAADEPV